MAVNSNLQSRVMSFAGLFIAGLVLVGLLRHAGTQESFLTPASSLATPLYVALTVGFILLFRRSGLNFKNLGFAPGFRLFHVSLAVAAVIALQLSAAFVTPLIEVLLGEGRNLSRFGNVHGSFSALLMMLALSWSFAAFGEEIAFRIVLLGSLITALGRSRGAMIVAVTLQALVFGIVHMYQGPAGIAGATISGLVFGTITVLARGSIWPAALAHGTNNSIGFISIYLGAG